MNAAAQKATDPGLKYDAGKPGYELLDFDTLADFHPAAAPSPVGQLWMILEDFAQRRQPIEILALELAARLMCPTSPEAAMRHEVARVLEFGARKYAVHNWRKGMRWSRVIGAAMRHLAAYERGEISDPETGLHHLGHFGCCVMFLIVYQRDGLGTDDRYVAPKEKTDAA